MSKITIIDYGMGNVGSIANMLKYLSIDSVITTDPNQIKQADKLILPGVGAFDQAIIQLKEYNQFDVINELVLIKKKPILGICLGMQLFGKSSEEGSYSGFAWLDATTNKFVSTTEYTVKIPHVGWNQMVVKSDQIITKNFNENTKFYFTHSYHFVCKDIEDIVGTTYYGYEFTSMVMKDNIFGCQFHPEKSHRYGMQLLKNFNDI